MLIENEAINVELIHGTRGSLMRSNAQGIPSRLTSKLLKQAINY